MRVVLHRTNDGIYVGRDETGRTLGSFYACPGQPGWWAGWLSNGTSKRLFVPVGDHEEVARRLFHER